MYSYILFVVCAGQFWQRLQIRTSNVPLTVLRLEIGSITETAKRTIFYVLSIRNLERYLVNLASGFCFFVNLVTSQPRHGSSCVIGTFGLEVYGIPNTHVWNSKHWIVHMGVTWT